MYKTDNNNIDDYDEDDEVIDLSELEPIYDKNCKHYFVKDGDELGGKVGWSCKHCHRGKFFPKGVTIINS